MKKLLLLLSVGVVVNGAYAQKVSDVSIMATPLASQHETIDGKRFTVQEMKQATAWKHENSRASNKGTISGTRTINYVEFMDILNTPSQSLPYMWADGNGMGIYSQTGGGFVIDTIALMSIGAVLHPWMPLFNDEFALDYKGKVGIQVYSPYTVDSVAFYGVYGRNSQKHNIVDTLRVSLVYGTGATGQDIRVAGWYLNGQPGVFQQRYGYDTIRVPTVMYDSVLRVARGTTRIVKDFIINSTTANDTISNGIHRFVVPFGTAIPAGNLVGATATFISGDPNQPAPYTDTIFRGNAVAGQEAFKYNMFRPMMFGQNANQYPKYDPQNLNVGLGMIRIYDTNNAFYDTYVGSYFWGQDSDLEFPYMDWVVSCADCPAVNIDNVQGLIADVNVYPNPAVNEVRVPFALGTAADVRVNFTNVMGQVISRQSFTNVTTGEAVFTTSHLPNGVYLINIEAGGENKVERVTVTH